MPTKTRRIIRVTKGHKTISNAENAVGNLPVKVDNWLIRIKEEKVAST